MTIDDIQLVYEYDRGATDRVFRAVCALNVEQFTRDLGGRFRSVRDTLVHIIAGEWIWLADWREQAHRPDLLAELRTRRETLFNPGAFPDVVAAQSRWAEVEADQIAFVSGLTDESLKTMLPARGTQLSLAHRMQHLANHSTYHRGQIALMMRQLDAEPPAADFHVFLAEGRRQTASAM
jgi:uncharacterized damage-inducible protein DinB